jgi:hypothetical protein
MTATKEIKFPNKFRIREVLHHLQAYYNPEEIPVNDMSPVKMLSEILRHRREDPERGTTNSLAPVSTEAPVLRLQSVLNYM